MHRTQHPTASAADTDTATVVTPADTLRGAAHYLIRHGLHQGTYYPRPDNPADPKYQPFPPACVVGALAMAAYGRRRDSVYTAADDSDGLRALTRAGDALTDYLARTEPTGSPLWEDTDLDFEASPFTWNDDPNRTANQVIAALNAAADEWDRTHGGTR
jgi:hypothetical protein